MADEIEERLSNRHAIVGNRCSLHTTLVHLIVEDAGIVSIDQDLGDDVLGELGVALHSNVLARFVHGLDGAKRVGTKGDRVAGEVAYDVAVHLMDALRGTMG